MKYPMLFGCLTAAFTVTAVLADDLSSLFAEGAIPRDDGDDDGH